MKNLVIASIVALGVAAPAVAQNSLTLNQQVETLLKAHEDSANERATFFGNARINF